MNRSIVFLTTPTSATASLWRVLLAMNGGRYKPFDIVHRHYVAQRMDLVATEVPPATGHLVKHNAPHLFNRATPLADYRFLLHARDPRDVLCNQYHWHFVHPFPGETPEQEAARRQRIAAMGIDEWVLAQDFTPTFRGFMDVAQRINPADRLFIGYVRYCLHFDEVMERIANFLGTSIDAMTPAQLAALEQERVANLAGNPKWIGQTWAGADTAPGRHRQELQPRTIWKLSNRYAWFLDFLRETDDPRVTAEYN
ncbi:hypothetical protein [Roseococcus microcysteis]|uniref:hypothetical protein n=1 Tax=Roseococcus microcysteis TaxID=2771361 RepID=UPI00168BF8CB|nr:hypothetical protein [Roseococcus microcysteis]